MKPDKNPALHTTYTSAAANSEAKAKFPGIIKAIIHNNYK